MQAQPPEYDGVFSLDCSIDIHVRRRATILESLSTPKLAELAKNLAQDVAKRYPPAIANSPIQIVSQQRLASILEEVFVNAAQFGRENTLGWYKKTRLGRRFRWELNELGYDSKFVDQATEKLNRCVSGRPVSMI